MRRSRVLWLASGLILLCAVLPFVVHMPGCSKSGSLPKDNGTAVREPSSALEDRNEFESGRQEAPLSRQWIRVLDPCGAPLPGIHVDPSPDLNQGEPQFVTSQDGTCAVPAPDTGALRISIGALGGPRVLELGERPKRDGPVDIVLEHGSILGRISGPDSRLDSAMVYVWPLHSAADARGVERGTAAGLEPVQPDGTFRVCGLDPELSYQVVAGGNGWCSEQVIAPVRPGSTVEVPLRRVFGALIRFQEASGAPARMTDALFVSAGMGFRGSRVATRLNYSSVQARLLGLPPTLLTPNANEQLKLLFGDASDQVLGPFTAEAEYPGYERVQLDWTATPIERGLSMLEITLTPTGGGFGSLRLACGKTAVQACNPPGTSLPVLCLQLTEEQSGKTLNYSLPYPLGDTVKIDAIPSARYRAKVVAMHKAFSSEPVLVEVGVGTTSEFELDLSGLCCVEVELRLHDQTYIGPARVSIHIPASIPANGVPGMPDGTLLGRDAQSSFERAPYMVPFLPKGTYEVSVVIPGVGRSTRKTIACGTASTSPARFSLP